MVLNETPNWPKSSYDSKVDNIATDFFIPALFESISYRRIAGLFSSNSFALSARGISELIANEGNMQLIISPILSREDAQVLRDATEIERDEILTKSIRTELHSIENEFEKDHIFALKYLLKEEFLEIRINIIKDEFGNPLDAQTVIKENRSTEKRGIFQDRLGQCVSFRGPIDENKDSWEKGVFSITVDSSWNEGQLPHVKDDIEIFNKIWNSSETRKLPDAIKEEIIKDAPKKDEINLEKYDVPEWAILNDNRTLWPNQIRAVNAWKNNNHKGIFSIATSGGKTLSAIVSANSLPKNVLVLVIAPGIELSDQWSNEILRYDGNSEILLCNGKHSWKDKISSKINKFLVGNEANVKNRNYIIATPETAKTEVFLNNFRFIDEKKLCLIGDEVHHLGSPKNQKIMEIQSSFRLGLSATYRRGWDEDGTSQIINYFGRALTEAEYSISEGIRDKRLSSYSYHPFFATLLQSEFEDYYELTLQIARRNENESEETKKSKNRKIQEILLTQRADILKKAENKILTYKEIIKNRPKEPYIVFADDFEQVKKLRIGHKDAIRELNEKSQKILNDDVMIFSGKTEPHERKIILDQAISRKKPIFAMYCLDEGIDIPEFNSAILVSSSRSKRQYIQRRGRILRKAKKEEIAQLYDIVVFPLKQDDVIKNEAAILIIKKEFERVNELSADAINKFEALSQFDNQKTKLGFL